MKGAAPAYLKTWEWIMAQELTIPFSPLAVGTEDRGYGGNEWLLLPHHSCPSLFVYNKEHQIKSAATTAIILQWRYQAEGCLLHFKPWYSSHSVTLFATNNTNSKYIWPRAISDRQTNVNEEFRVNFQPSDCFHQGSNFPKPSLHFASPQKEM